MYIYIYIYIKPICAKVMETATKPTFCSLLTRCTSMKNIVWHWNIQPDLNSFVQTVKGAHASRSCRTRVDYLSDLETLDMQMGQVEATTLSLLPCAVKVKSTRPRSLAQGQGRYLKVGGWVRLNMVSYVFMMSCYIGVGMDPVCPFLT